MPGSDHKRAVQRDAMQRLRARRLTAGQCEQCGAPSRFRRCFRHRQAAIIAKRNNCGMPTEKGAK